MNEDIIKNYRGILEKLEEVDDEIFLMRENLIMLNMRREGIRARLFDLVFSLMDKKSLRRVYQKGKLIEVTLNDFYTDKGELFLKTSKERISPKRILSKDKGKTFIEEYNETLLKLNILYDKRFKK